MKKIHLFCSAGMSTSLLASNMQDVANKYKLPVEVEAFPLSTMEEVVKEKKSDCILLGPQVKYSYDTAVATLGYLGIPIAVIDHSDYGMMNGEKVLKTAVKMIKENK